MLSKAQYIEKLEKIEMVVKLFLSDKKTIKDISNETGISKSSVQRYLNDEEFIRDIFGSEADFIIEEINRRLSENKEEGNLLGGNVFASNYNAIKDEQGHFIGSRKK